MPLANNAQMDWNGYLVEGLAGCSGEFFKHFQKLISSRQLPRVNMGENRINMWWRKDSVCVDIASDIDGSVQCTVHAMDYGPALFIGVAYAAVSTLGNYYKRMAAAAFLETVDRCVSDAVAQTAQDKQTASPQIKQIGKGGKFGG